MILMHCGCSSVDCCSSLAANDKADFAEVATIVGEVNVIVVGEVDVVILGARSAFSFYLGTKTIMCVPLDPFFAFWHLIFFFCYSC